MKYQTVYLDQGAIDLVRDNLSYGKTLSKLLSCRSDLEAGSVFAFLPPNMRGKEIENYRWGGIANRIKSQECLIEFLYDSLTTNPDSLCIFENTVARRGDPCVFSWRSHILTFQDEVYHCVESAEVTVEAIDSAIIEAERAFWFIGATCSGLGREMVWSNKVEFNLADIETLATKVENIIAGAFDGEGYVIWQRAK